MMRAAFKRAVRYLRRERALVVATSAYRMLGQKPAQLPPPGTTDPEGQTWMLEAGLARSTYARHQAIQLIEQARSIVAFCERECDYSALLIGEAKGLRRGDAA